MKEIIRARLHCQHYSQHLPRTTLSDEQANRLAANYAAWRNYLLALQRGEPAARPPRLF